MVVKHYTSQSKNAIIRARQQMQKDFDSALPILEELDKQRRLYLFTEHLRNVCWLERRQFEYTPKEVASIIDKDSRYSQPMYQYHLDFPEVEQEVAVMRVLSQGNGGVYNSALNRKRTSAKGYAAPLEDIPRSQRRFSTTEDSQYYRERLNTNRALYADGVPQYNPN